MTGVRVYDPRDEYHVEYRHIWPLCQHGYVSGGCTVCNAPDDGPEVVAMAPAEEPK